MDRLNVTRVFQTLVITLLVLGSVATIGEASTLANSWIYFARDAKNVLRLCPKNDSMSYLICIKYGSLELFDRLTTADVIPLTQHVQLMRYRDNDIGNEEANDVKRNLSKSRYSQYRGVGSNDVDAVTWSSYVMKRFLDVLSTHTIQVDLTEKSKERARHRHRNQMLPMMAFGMTALGMVLVPIGFQFLAVLGGKALLLAKMALLLASINGIKRVATSGVHYGLYHTDPHYHQGVWERSDNAYMHPRAMNRLRPS